MDKIFWKKVILSFVRGFAATFITLMLGLLASPEFHWQRSALISVVVGALTAGLRAVQAYFTNLEPGDEIHGT